MSLRCYVIIFPPLDHHVAALTGPLPPPQCTPMSPGGTWGNSDHVPESRHTHGDPLSSVQLAAQLLWDLNSMYSLLSLSSWSLQTYIKPHVLGYYLDTSLKALYIQTSQSWWTMLSDTIVILSTHFPLSFVQVIGRCREISSYSHGRIPSCWASPSTSRPSQRSHSGYGQVQYITVTSWSVTASQITDDLNICSTDCSG